MQISLDWIAEILTAGRGQSQQSITDRETQALAAYEGGDVLFGYIYPFSSSEDALTLRNRRLQTLNHYQNWPRYTVRAYLESVYRSQQIRREAIGDDAFTRYLQGEHAAFLEREAAPNLILLDECYVVVSDSPDSPIAVDTPDGQTVTMQDLRDDRYFPRASLLFPSHVAAVDFDRARVIKYIAIIDGNARDVYTETEYCRVVPTGDSQFPWTYEIPPTAHGYTVNGSSACPVVAGIAEINHARQGKVGRSMMYEVVYMSIGCLQFVSMFIDAAYQHLAYKLVMGRATAETTSEIGNNVIIIEEPERNTRSESLIPTRYLQTPTVELDKLIEIIFDRIPAAILHAARLRMIGGEASGRSKVMDLLPELNMLQRVSSYLQTVEDRVIRLMAERIGIDPENIVCQYPMSFDVRSMSETLTDWASLAESISAGTLPKSETFLKETMKAFVRMFLPGIAPETQKEIDDEIEAFKIESTAAKDMQNVTEKIVAPAMAAMDQKTMTTDQSAQMELPGIMLGHNEGSPH